MPGTGVKHWSLGSQINKDAGNAKQMSLKLVEGYSTKSLAFCFSEQIRNAAGTSKDTLISQVLLQNQGRGGEY